MCDQVGQCEAGIGDGESSLGLVGSVQEIGSGAPCKRLHPGDLSCPPAALWLSDTELACLAFQEPGCGYIQEMEAERKKAL